MAITKITTPELFDFSATNTALQLPTGDTASRPSAPSTGEWRFNSELKYVEYYDGAAWFQIDTEGNIPTANENFNTNTYFGNGGTQTLDAKFNEAANFNGSSSSFSFSNSAYGSSTTVFTASGWFKHTSSANSREDIYFGNGATVGGLSGYAIYTDYSTGNIGLSFRTNPNQVFYNSSTNIKDGNWHHVCLTYNNGVYVLYVDNVSILNGTSSYYLNNLTPSKDTFVGSRYGTTGAGTSIIGAVDQIRIYDSALSAAQAEDLYTDETTTTAATLNFPAGAGCVAAYQLDGNGDDISTNYNGTTTNIGYTGFKFTPDFVWIKQTSSPTKDHMLFDTVRGPSTDLNILYSNLINDEDNGSSTFLQSISTNALNLGSSNYVNGSGLDYVAWCWKAAASTTTIPSGTNGSNVISNVRANTEGGFSIVKFGAVGAANSIVSHGLSSTPELIIYKNLITADNWYVYTSTTGLGKYLYLNDDSLVVTNPSNGFTSVNENTFTSNLTTNADDTVAYCFHSVEGYSKIDSYVGTANAGNFQFTGFQPSWLMVKCSSADSRYWVIVDNKRGNSEYWLYPNTSDSQQGPYPDIAFNSTGFTLGTNASYSNGSGDTYIYLAIA